MNTESEYNKMEVSLLKVYFLQNIATPGIVKSWSPGSPLPQYHHKELRGVLTREIKGHSSERARLLLYLRHRGHLLPASPRISFGSPLLIWVCTSFGFFLFPSLQPPLSLRGQLFAISPAFAPSLLMSIRNLPNHWQAPSTPPGTCAACDLRQVPAHLGLSKGRAQSVQCPAP